MSMVRPPTSVSTTSGLKITLAVIGSIGLAVWGTSIGFMVGWLSNLAALMTLKTLIGIAVSIPVNAAMIYVACRLMFLVMQRSFPNQLALQDLHQCVARMVALTVLGFSTWVASVVWLAEYIKYHDHVYSYNDSYYVYHACNYGFVISMIVAGLAGGILTSCSRNDAIQMQAGPQRYMMPQSQPQSQGHYNQAYAPPYGQQYR